MKKGREILGLPVIALSSGARLGAVRDLVVDLERRAAVALLLSDAGVEAQTRLVPFDMIRRVGPDAVVVQNESCVVSSTERPELEALAQSPVKVVGLQVFTDEGRLLGTVSDVMVDDRSGSIRQYEVSSGLFRDVIRGRKYLSVSTPRSMGDELMVVPEGVMPASESELEEGPPLVPVVLTSHETESRPHKIEQIAADLVIQQSDLIVGMRSEKTITDDDSGLPIVFRGEPISQEVVEKAKAAGKLNELVEAAGEPAALALARGPADRYARVAVGRMAARTVHTPGGAIVVAQGDVITREEVLRAREAGVLDQLAEAVREAINRGETAGTSRREAAGALWDQISARVGWLTGRR